MPSLPGRPKAITPKVQREIIRLLRQGNYLSTACLAAGITPDTWHYWRKLVDAGAKHAVKAYADFFGACHKALALAEADSVASTRSGRQGWQGPAWYLARRYPKRWGKRREETDPEADKEVTPNVDVIREFLGPAGEAPDAG